MAAPEPMVMEPEETHIDNNASLRPTSKSSTKLTSRVIEDVCGCFQLVRHARPLARGAPSRHSGPRPPLPSSARSSPAAWRLPHTSPTHHCMRAKVESRKKQDMAGMQSQLHQLQYLAGWARVLATKDGCQTLRRTRGLILLVQETLPAKLISRKHSNATAP